MTTPLAWEDVPSQQRSWNRPVGVGCQAALAYNVGGGSLQYSPCYGFVRDGQRWCWNHDPTIQTPQFKAWRRERVADGRRRAKAMNLLIAGWVGEAEYTP